MSQQERDSNIECEQTADECNKPFVAVWPILWDFLAVWTIPRNDTIGVRGLEGPCGYLSLSELASSDAAWTGIIWLGEGSAERSADTILFNRQNGISQGGVGEKG